MSRYEGLRTCGGREHPKHQSADLTFQVLGSFTRTKSDFLEHREHEKFKCHNPAVVPALSSTLSTFWFWLYGETLLSEFHVEDTCTQRFTTFHNVSFNLSDVIVFVASIADVSIQRRSSPFDPSTSSSQSSRLSQTSCFRTDKSIAKRLLSTSAFAMRVPLLRKLFPPIDELSCPLMSTMVALVRNPCSTALDRAVSFCHQCTAADSSDSRRTTTQRVNEHFLGIQRAVIQVCCDLEF